MNRDQLRKLLDRLPANAAAQVFPQLGSPSTAEVMGLFPGSNDGPAIANSEVLATASDSGQPVVVGTEGRFAFKRPPNDAGGFVTGFDIASNGTDYLCSTDVFNAYLRRSGEEHWTALFNTETLPPKEYDPKPKEAVGGWGCFAARFAPSDPQRIYAIWNAVLFRFDGGKAARTVLPSKKFRISGPNRRFSDTIAVHAENRDLVIVGTQGDGCYASKDGFARSYVTLDLPQPGKDWSGKDGKYLVAFHGDEAFVHVFGVGLYHFAQGPFGPSRFIGRAGDGEPVNASCLKVTPSGTVWICRYRSGRSVSKETPQQRAARGLWRWKDGQWTQFTSVGSADQVAIDPYDERQIICTDENSQHWWLSNDGETFQNIGGEFRGSGEVAWLSNRKKAMYPSKIGFHPLERDTIVISDGVGMTMTRLPSFGEKLTVHDFSRGIYEFVSSCGISKPGQRDVIVGCMDKPVWRVTPATGLTGEWTYCDKNGAPGPSAVAHIRSIDDAIDDPDYLAGLFHQSNSAPGFSEDWGASWKPFGRKPDGKAWLPGGCVAVSTRDTILLAEGNNGGLWRSVDGGGNWLPVGFGGFEHVRNLVNAYYVHRKCIAADKQRSGTFAVLMNTFKQPDSELSLGGLWVTRDGGQTFEQTFDGALHAPGERNYEPSQFWQARLEYVPGHPGELLYASCSARRDGERLLWSRDDGRSWTVLPAYRMKSWAFGKGTGKRPAIFFSGMFDGVSGWYVSLDWFATPPTLIARFPGGNLDSVGLGLSMVGDMNTVGRAAVGFSGSSWMFCELRT